MKIAWFTPLSPGCAASDFSRLVCPQLSRQAEVHIWRPPLPQPPHTPLPCFVFESAASLAPADLAPYDLLVYNLGRHFSSFSEIYRASQLFPGVTILHDFFMRPFFAKYCLDVLHDPAAYSALMKRHYGAPGEAFARQPAGLAAQPENLDPPHAIQFPLCEEAVAGSCLGVIVHSRFLLQRLAGSAACLLNYIPFPAGPAPAPSPATPAAAPDFGPRLLIAAAADDAGLGLLPLLWSVLARNRRLADRLLLAIQMPEKDPGRPASHDLRIPPGLESSVRLFAPPPDPLFQSCLERAILFMDLRLSPPDGAPALLVGQMRRGVPVFSSTAALFSELPDHCVPRISPSTPLEELESSLLPLVENPRLRADRGASAKAFADHAHCPENYAASFLRFASSVISASPVLRLTSRIRNEFSDLGVPAHMGALENLAGAIHSLFCPSNGPDFLGEPSREINE